MSVQTNVEKIKSTLETDAKVVLATNRPDILTHLLATKNGQLKYAEEGGELIGLNLANTGLTDAQWLEILSLIDASKIQALNLNGNALGALEFPASFSDLKHLEVANNKDLTSIQFKAGLGKLSRLIIRDNNLSTLQLPDGFEALEYLDVSRNRRLKFFDFKGILALLKYIDFNNTQFKNVDVLCLEDLPVLEYWGFYNCPLNESLRVHHKMENGNNYVSSFTQLKEEFKKGERIKNEEYKVILVGDGTAGKTCLVNRLIKNKFIEEDSTHGIKVRQYKDEEDLYSFRYTLNIWDFGGQDLYHTTHRLFLQSNASYLLVWNKKTEEEATSKAKQGKKWKNYKNRKINYLSLIHI